MTTTFRADEGLAFLLQYENVAWYDAGEVRILDRRVYPAKTEFVTCRTHGEVAQAIRDMVTQSAGPYTAAAMGAAKKRRRSSSPSSPQRTGRSRTPGRPRPSA